MLFADKKRLAEVETSLIQLQIKFEAIESAWSTERMSLANIKEQAIKAVNRLDQRARRAEQKENGGEPEEKPINPMAQRLLRGTNVVLPR